jgi:hypothetical protein
VSTRYQLLRPLHVQEQSYFEGKLDTTHQSLNLRKLVLQFDFEPYRVLQVTLLNLVTIEWRQTFLIFKMLRAKLSLMFQYHAADHELMVTLGLLRIPFRILQVFYFQ